MYWALIVVTLSISIFSYKNFCFLWRLPLLLLDVSIFFFFQQWIMELEKD